MCSGGGGGTTSTNTVQNADPWTGVQPYLTDVFTNAYNLYRQPQIGTQSQFTKDAIAKQGQRAMQGNPLVPQAQAQMADTIGGKYLDPGTNPAWQQITNRMTDAYQTGTAANLDARFAKGGNAFMDNSAYQQQKMMNDRAFGDVLGGVAGDLYGKERQLQMNATGAAPGMAAADYADISQLGAAGAMKDARSQMEVDAPWANLGKYGGAVSGQYGGTTSSTSQSPYFTNPMGSALGMGIGGLQLYNGLNSAGLLGGGAGMLGGIGGSLGGWGLLEEGAALAGMFSDVRLKTDIEKVGKTDSGLGVYTYKYVGDDTTRMGVMAQEVAQVKPEAVGKAAGFLTVDYGKL